jgi:hypothetical protein
MSLTSTLHWFLACEMEVMANVPGLSARRENFELRVLICWTLPFHSYLARREVGKDGVKKRMSEQHTHCIERAEKRKGLLELPGWRALKQEAQFATHADVLNSQQRNDTRSLRHLDQDRVELRLLMLTLPDRLPNLLLAPGRILHAHDRDAVEPDVVELVVRQIQAPPGALDRDLPDGRCVRPWRADGDLELEWRLSSKDDVALVL